jgi:hypothetical protein
MIKQLHDIDDIWDYIKDVVQKHGGYSKSDIHALVKSNEMQAHGIPGVCGFITTIIQYPQLRVLLVQFGGGRGMDEWKYDIRGYFEEYARWNVCDEIQILGRIGWSRIYPDMKTGWAVYRRQLGAIIDKETA